MTDRPRQIISLGGGGFSMEPDNLALDKYILEQAPVDNPAVAFVPTASGDSDHYLTRFYTAFSGLPCRPRHLPLFHAPPDVRSFVLSQDVIYVGGGNTKSMLAIWHEWDLNDIFCEAWERGIVLAGISAGAICWFEEGVTDSVGGELTAMPCLGLLKGSCCPHYDGEAERRPAFHRLLKAGQLRAGYAIDDGVAVHFVGNDVGRVVSSRPGAAAYRVAVVGGSIIEDRVPADLLVALRPTWPTF